MLTHLVIFRSAMVRQMYDLPDAFRAMPRDFVRISELCRPEGRCEQAGAFLSVPYSADYAFYRKRG